MKNVPYGVLEFLQGHQVELEEDLGWARISNGDLIKTAEAAGFDTVLTADQNIVYQQNLKGRKVALVVLGSNIWPVVLQHAAAIATQVDSARPGSYAFLEMPLPPKPRGRFRR